MPRSDRLTRRGRKMLHPQWQGNATKLRYQIQGGGCSMHGSSRSKATNSLFWQGVDMHSPAVPNLMEEIT